MSITPILEIVKKGGHSKDLTELELANIVRAVFRILSERSNNSLK